jgi:hypothetical protein
MLEVFLVESTSVCLRQISSYVEFTFEVGSEVSVSVDVYSVVVSWFGFVM